MLVQTQCLSKLLQTNISYGKNIASLSQYWQLNLKKQENITFPQCAQLRHKGHSKWQNRKFKKMHIDNERAKIFGRYAMEIIQAVKESGPDVKFNSKLSQLVTKAKASNMPKEKIDIAINNSVRASSEKRTSVLLQARGPGKCGLLISALTPNATRTMTEIRTILKKKEATYIDDGSVAFMFLHKGVLAIKDSLEDDEDFSAKEQAEEIAIMIGAENVLRDSEREVFQFLCPPLELLDLQKRLTSSYPHVEIVSADVQYLAKDLIELAEELLGKSNSLIESLYSHPDVTSVDDNIKGYASATIKLRDLYFNT